MRAENNKKEAEDRRIICDINKKDKDHAGFYLFELTCQAAGSAGKRVDFLSLSALRKCRFLISGTRSLVAPTFHHDVEH